VIVATSEAELPGLAELERRGHANGVPGLRRLDGAQLREIEPHARGVAALHSPNTGIADFPAVARAFAEDVREAGGTVTTGNAVSAVSDRPNEVVIEHAAGATAARAALVCAGAWADRLAVKGGAPADPRIVPFRGAYLRLRPERRDLVRGLIYPVPDPELPFLGVHLTRHVDGDVLIGPTALLSPARDAYRLRTARGRDIRESLAWPGTWRMARRFWRTGLSEIGYAASRRRLVRAAARFVPDLEPRDAVPGPAGVRAQALGRDGRLIDDFVFSRTGRTLHVRNAPSPAATSALAIAREIADQVAPLLRRAGNVRAP
jgi:(S)-2-hydroxyglutarate dehydrogenase